ncbi:MAG: hypothetical protein JW866_06410 [Ignavibacteriales bacterium]|nr:hypothetical protein [Ignavibacteriales bacterium]
MASILKQEEIIIDTLEINRKKAGLRRNLTQVKHTISFELRRNLRKLEFLLIFHIVIFILSFLIVKSLESFGLTLPEDSAEYMQEHIGSFLAVSMGFSVSALGGPIIAEDFDKQTGNLLFPKISKGRLLIGRLIARFFYMAICLLSFYILIGIVTFIEYQNLPLTYFYSYTWGLFFSFAILSFYTLISSFMKTTSMTIVFGILFFAIVFQMIPMILSMAGLLNNNELPMYFILNYYGAMVVYSLKMPVSRFEINKIPGTDNEYTSWETPSEIGAAIGLLLYIVITLLLAYVIYYRRQSKGE